MPYKCNCLANVKVRKLTNVNVVKVRQKLHCQKPKHIQWQINRYLPIYNRDIKNKRVLHNRTRIENCTGSREMKLKILIIVSQIKRFYIVFVVTFDYADQFFYLLRLFIQQGKSKSRFDTVVTNFEFKWDAHLSNSLSSLHSIKWNHFLSVYILRSFQLIGNGL